MWAEATLAAIRARHKAFCELFQVLPLLDMRSFDILEDRRSSWWKSPRHLSRCLEEVSTEKLPGQGHSHWTLCEEAPDIFYTMSFIP